MLSSPDDAQLALRLGAAGVCQLDGHFARLRDVWGDTPVVLGFLRHYGCLFCHELAAELLDRAQDVMASGGRVVLVGNGAPEHARRFAASKGLPRPGVVLVTDPGEHTHRVAGFERSFVKTFLDGDARRAYRRARSGGHAVTGWFGDLIQLGGLLVIHPPATPAYVFRARHAGELPDFQVVLAAVSARTPARSTA